MRVRKENPEVGVLKIPMGADWISSNGREHWRPKAQKSKAWRQTAMLVGQSSGLVFTVPVDVVVQVHKRFASNRWDPHNLWPTAKPVIDGLVDAGVLVDDDTKHIRSSSIRAGEADRLRPGLTITIRPVQEDQP